MFENYNIFFVFHFIFEFIDVLFYFTLQVKSVKKDTKQAHKLKYVMNET